MPIRLHSPRVRWSKEKEIEIGLTCRRQEGYPMYLSKFAEIPFRVEGEPAFMMKCWGGKGPEITTVFTHVPKEEIKDIEEDIGDWARRIKKFGTPEQIRENEEYGIYIAGYRLPRIVRD